MATFVLVHGAMHGGWCWREVRQRLSGNGHEVYAPTLTGQGDRGRALTPQVGIADHVTVGEGARVAAKSGVIGDVPAGTVVAGYPAVARVRWLRALARAFRGL